MWGRTGDGLEHMRSPSQLARGWIGDRGIVEAGGPVAARRGGDRSKLYVGQTEPELLARPARGLPRGSWKCAVPSTSLTWPEPPPCFPREPI